MLLSEAAVAKHRSPILGYNHNIRHLGLVFHVQTEDSGIDHPHIFTHCFFGGVIIDSRKLDYDAEAAEESVKALMQAQHKASLKRLKKGEFDDKIYQYFGDNPDLVPREGGAPKSEAELVEELQSSPPVAAAPPAAEPPPPEPVAEQPSEVSAAFDAISDEDIDDHRPTEVIDVPPMPEQAPPPQVSPVPPRRATAVTVKPSTPAADSIPGRGARVSFVRPSKADNTPAPEPVHTQPTAPVRARPAGKARRVADRAGEGGRGVGPSVVVSRPAVIVGAPSKVVGSGGRAGSQPRRFGREKQSPSRSGLFGKDLVSEKSLDEVILAYLSEDSNEE